MLNTNYKSKHEICVFRCCGRKLSLNVGLRNFLQPSFASPVFGQNIFRGVCSQLTLNLGLKLWVQGYKHFVYASVHFKLQVSDRKLEGKISQF